MAQHDIEAMWEAHLRGEFETEDLEATLATMTDDAYVIHVPVQTGGRGRAELRRFYGEVFIGSWPDDLETTLVSRTIGESSLVDEMRMVFTHKNRMEWFLPDVAPTGRTIVLDVVAVIGFRDGLLEYERIYWDHASVLRQAGLMDAAG
jgi:carboxymethylenebutenolidase